MSLLIVCGASLREYTLQRDRVLSGLEQQLDTQPVIGLFLYRGDSAALAGELQKLLAPPVVGLVVYTPQQESLLAEGDISADLFSFDRIRKGKTPAETGLVSMSASGTPTGSGLLSALLDPGSAFHLTVPVISGINPLEKNVPDARFLLASAGLEGGGSQHVMGYIHLAVSQLGVARQIVLFVVVVTLACALFALLCIVLSLRHTRRITAPLARLARAADDLASGRLEEPVAAQGSGEIQEIATILNGVFEGVSNYKTRMDVDHQLLSMKVEERTSQLSRRNEELNKAVKQVTQTKNRLRQMAYYDSLTALPNRRLFTEQLSLLLRLAKRNKEQLAVLFLDLDNFKRINDSLGHSAGDLLLREVGSRLSACVRDSDVVAHYVDSDTRIGVSRLGGDEFTVVLNHVDSIDAVEAIAQRLIDALVEPMMINGHELVVTPSLGVALAPDHANDVEGLLRCADTAMYHAKAAGKNNYLLYASEMDAAGLDRLTLETDLRRALAQNELVLYYQPQVDTNTGAVVGAEALMRWEHPEQGLIPPFRFIPLAEEMGLIGEMGDWAIKEACQQVMRYAEQGLKLPKVAVNVSALQFTPSFIRKVKEILDETGVDPNVLQLELTEGVVMGDTSASIKALEELKAMGVSLSIDDFGTGYSSLSYLSRFPLDELKIDRSFVIAAHDSEEDASLVVAIMAMANGLGLDVVAEGVETHEQYYFITDHDAHVIQGYMFSKPVPADEFAELLTPWHFMNQIRRLTDARSSPAPG